MGYRVIRSCGVCDRALDTIFRSYRRLQAPRTCLLLTPVIIRLRLKIRVPYQSLQKHVSKLDRIQQASDILRRTARFVILTRRLELQLAEMTKADAAEPGADAAKPKAQPPKGGARADTPLENEDDKERAIAKAALTIAELSQCPRPGFGFCRSVGAVADVYCSVTQPRSWMRKQKHQTPSTAAQLTRNRAAGSESP